MIFLKYRLKNNKNGISNLLVIKLNHLKIGCSCIKYF